jgi:hypothetical protein
MSHVSESALKSIPKKPLNAYFKFRGERLIHYAGDEDRVKKVKDEWESMDEKVKEKLDAEYKESLEDYKKELAAWKSKNGVDEEDWKIIVKKEKEIKKAEKSEKSKGSRVSQKEEKKEEKKKDDKSKDAKNDKKSEVSKDKGKDEKKMGMAKGGCKSRK